jgi:hypothetical protein
VWQLIRLVLMAWPLIRWLRQHRKKTLRQKLLARRPSL